MVCDRCVMVVRELLCGMGLGPLHIELGRAVLPRRITAAERGRLECALVAVGFSLIEDRRGQLVQLVKGAVIELVQKNNGGLRVNLSDYLGGRFGHDYDYISRVFSEEEGTTVERYFIAQRIERVKELLSYGEHSLSEIADMMNYSSAAHLSAQFKRVTGITPTAFRNESGIRRPLDKV